MSAPTKKYVKLCKIALACIVLGFIVFVLWFFQSNRELAEQGIEFDNERVMRLLIICITVALITTALSIPLIRNYSQGDKQVFWGILSFTIGLTAVVYIGVGAITEQLSAPAEVVNTGRIEQLQKQGYTQVIGEGETFQAEKDGIEYRITIKQEERELIISRTEMAE